MAKYTQANRPIALTTPLGPDALLLEKITGTEALSEPFRFQLDLLAEVPVDFDRLLGQKVTVSLSLPNGTKRSINGIINRLSQGARVPAADGKATFLRYRAELVPELWLLNRRVQSRVFQHQSVPDILGQVLRQDWRLEVSFRLTGQYQPRNFCVQYRESDFAFVSRLMEDEGIRYSFEHTADNHVLIVTDTGGGRMGATRDESVTFDDVEGGTRNEARIYSWEKTQELRSCKHTLWDYCFEKSESNLEASAAFPDAVVVGKVRHRLNHQRVVNDVELLEVFDYPGGYAQRFDGIDRNGGERPAELGKLFADAPRTAKIRVEQEAAQALLIRGAGACGHFAPGNRFTLQRHSDGDGQYLLTRVEHTASLRGTYTTGAPAETVYENRFECLPVELAFRPQRNTPRPRIDGTQTATVVGPAGVDPFVDKYGRVKVRFHWDRQRQSNADGSCWVRVAQTWAGKNYGAFFWPRLGHEVVVAFEEGDPDRPVIIGSVYNDVNPPPLPLPAYRFNTGLKSCSANGNSLAQFSGLMFQDQRGDERLYLHSQGQMFLGSETETSIKSGDRLRRVVGGPFLGLLGSGSGGGLFRSGVVAAPTTAAPSTTSAPSTTASPTTAAPPTTPAPPKPAEPAHKDAWHDVLGHWVPHPTYDYGIHVKNSFGIHTDSTFGAHVGMQFNPLALHALSDELPLRATAFPKTAWNVLGTIALGAVSVARLPLELLGGSSHFLVGSDVHARYGAGFSIHYGRTLESHSILSHAPHGHHADPELIFSRLAAGACLGVSSMCTLVLAFVPVMKDQHKSKCEIAFHILEGLALAILTQIERRAAIADTEKQNNVAAHFDNGINQELDENNASTKTLRAYANSIKRRLDEAQSHNRTLNGPFALTAQDIRFTSQDPGAPTTITINARGQLAPPVAGLAPPDNDGTLNLIASRTINIGTGAPTPLNPAAFDNTILFQTGPAAHADGIGLYSDHQIRLRRNMPGPMAGAPPLALGLCPQIIVGNDKITLSARYDSSVGAAAPGTGPRIVLDGANQSITLQVGDDAAGPKIALTRSGIKLSMGAAGNQKSIEIRAAGAATPDVIHLRCGDETALTLLPNTMLRKSVNLRDSCDQTFTITSGIVDFANVLQEKHKAGRFVIVP